MSTYVEPRIVTHHIRPCRPIAQSTTTITFDTSIDTDWDGNRTEVELVRQQNIWQDEWK